MPDCRALATCDSLVAQGPSPRTSTMVKALASLAFVLASIGFAMAQTAPANVVKELAPSGTLRAALNFGNTVLAQRDPAGGAPRGVSADLARELAKRLGVPIAYAGFDAAGK